MTPLQVLARTLFGEARGEPIEGKAAVANVILNRADKGGWWGDTVEDVCRKPYQFSCWNRDDPNFAILANDCIYGDVFQECLAVAKLAEMRLLVDNTVGATHYHTLESSPKWAQGRTPVVTIGHHKFYKGIL